MPWLVAFARSSTARFSPLDVMRFLKTNFERVKKGLPEMTQGMRAVKDLNWSSFAYHLLAPLPMSKPDIPCLAIVMTEVCQLFVGEAKGHTQWRWLIASPQDGPFCP